MSGDYSRHRFDPRNHYAGVLMQQGRVQLDADWNEWTDVIDRRTRAETVDTFGVSPTPGISGVAVVSPLTPDAFRIEASGGSLTIDLGRMYVDGLLAENFGDAEGAQAFDPVLAEEHGTDPVAYDQQPYHPDPAALPGGGPHLAYLEVWQRELTYLQQPDLVEKALAVDTTTRTQTVWQVRLLEDIGAGISCTSSDADLGEQWQDIIDPSAGRLSSRDEGVPDDVDPCELPPSGGYRGLENQLYRIEIHEGGEVGSATFKWSRDNASVAAGVVEVVSDTELKLASLGRDSVLRINSGDWVEIIDDWRELSGENGDPARRFGEMRQVTVDDAAQTISFSPALPADLIPTETGDDTLELRHLRVIRWNQSGVVRDHEDNVIEDLDDPGSDGLIPVPAAGVWVRLEDGIEVQFSLAGGSGAFRCNDYWTVAARTTDAAAEHLDEAPPRGIHRHYARLAIVTFPDDEDDCREHWPPDCGGGCCTIMVNPGESIQEAINALPVEGGCVCLKTGVHEIRSPLELHASHIKLQGESPGAVVRAMTDLPYLLEIGSADLPVTGVELLSIRFEVTEISDGAFILYLNHCEEVRVAQCELEVLGDILSSHIGIWMQDVRDITVKENRLSNLLNGIWINDLQDRVIISDNAIEGMTVLTANAHMSLGEHGIRIDNDFIAPCYIERNLINDFWTGVRLGEGTSGSQVTRNRIDRRAEQFEEPVPSSIDELRAYLDLRLYAIDIESDHCRVETNTISLPNALAGGIRTRAEHTRIDGNELSASSKTAAFAAVPASIVCYGLTDVVEAANHSHITSNRLDGPQTGVVISRVDHVKVTGNVVQGMNAGWFGVVAANCNMSRVCGNRIQGVFFATYHNGGYYNRVCDNLISLCGTGIISLSEDRLVVSGNDVGGCLVLGITVEVAATVDVLENRVINCGYSGFASLGLAVFTESLFVESDSMVRIEGNEVLDTGINPLTGEVTDTRSIGIGALCASCHVSHNHTNYSQDVLQPQLEHRALFLIGPLALHYDFAAITFEWMSGSAVVTDNRFRGPGRSTLVEFFPVTINDFLDLRFEKVTFNNNICEHLNAEAQEDAATVRLWGRNLIAMANHVKANSNANAMSLGNRDRVALMGNITTGGYIRVGTVTPTPITDFNIRT